MSNEALKPEILTDEQVRAEQAPVDAVAWGLDKLAYLMDRSIVIPGTNLRVGLDAILGLLPIGGDAVAGLIQTAIVLVAVHQYKVPKAVTARMAANVLLDTTLGSIPLVGDAFDAVFKANTRNLRLLHEVRELRMAGKPVGSGASIRYLVGVAAVLLTVLGLVVVGFVTALAWVYHQFAR